MFLVVPLNVPALTEMDGSHLFDIDLMHREGMVFVWHILIQLHHRGEIHEVTCVDCDVSAKLFVSARLASTLLAIVLNVINHETSIVNELGHSARKIDVFVGFKIF